jgi:hypothetical protein
LYQGDVIKPRKAFRVAALSCQLEVTNGELLFQVNDEDHDSDNLYFDGDGEVVDEIYKAS